MTRRVNQTGYPISYALVSKISCRLKALPNLNFKCSLVKIRIYQFCGSRCKILQGLAKRLSYLLSTIQYLLSNILYLISNI